jgi:hypothetical protein
MAPIWRPLPEAWWEIRASVWSIAYLAGAAADSLEAGLRVEEAWDRGSAAGDMVVASRMAERLPAGSIAAMQRLTAAIVRLPRFMSLVRAVAPHLQKTSSAQ